MTLGENLFRSCNLCLIFVIIFAQLLMTSWRFDVDWGVNGAKIQVKRRFLTGALAQSKEVQLLRNAIASLSEPSTNLLSNNQLDNYHGLSYNWTLSTNNSAYFWRNSSAFPRINETLNVVADAPADSSNSLNHLDQQLTVTYLPISNKPDIIKANCAIKQHFWQQLSNQSKLIWFSLQTIVVCFILLLHVFWLFIIIASLLFVKSTNRNSKLSNQFACISTALRVYTFHLHLALLGIILATSWIMLDGVSQFDFGNSSFIFQDLYDFGSTPINQVDDCVSSSMQSISKPHRTVPNYYASSTARLDNGLLHVEPILSKQETITQKLNTNAISQEVVKPSSWIKQIYMCSFLRGFVESLLCIYWLIVVCENLNLHQLRVPIQENHATIIFHLVPGLFILLTRFLGLALIQVYFYQSSLTGFENSDKFSMGGKHKNTQKEVFINARYCNFNTLHDTITFALLADIVTRLLPTLLVLMLTGFYIRKMFQFKRIGKNCEILAKSNQFKLHHQLEINKNFNHKTESSSYLEIEKNLFKNQTTNYTSIHCSKRSEDSQELGKFSPWLSKDHDIRFDSINCCSLVDKQVAMTPRNGVNDNFLLRIFFKQIYFNAKQIYFKTLLSIALLAGIASLSSILVFIVSSKSMLSNAEANRIVGAFRQTYNKEVYEEKLYTLVVNIDKTVRIFCILPIPIIFILRNYNLCCQAKQNNNTQVPKRNIDNDSHLEPNNQPTSKFDLTTVNPSKSQPISQLTSLQKEPFDQSILMPIELDTSIANSTLSKDQNKFCNQMYTNQNLERLTYNNPTNFQFSSSINLDLKNGQLANEQNHTLLRVLNNPINSTCTLLLTDPLQLTNNVDCLPLHCSMSVSPILSQGQWLSNASNSTILIPSCNIDSTQSIAPIDLLLDVVTTSSGLSIYLPETSKSMHYTNYQFPITVSNNPI